jgi:hypothetical protein
MGLCLQNSWKSRGLKRLGRLVIRRRGDNAVFRQIMV